MGSSGRDWSQMYAIYGLSEWHTPLLLLLLSGVAAAFLSSFLLLQQRPPSLLMSLLALGSAVLSLSLILAASSLLHSSLTLHWHMCQRMVSAVPDWSSVRTALDLGCGRGILLNSVAFQLKKSGSSGCVVGLDRRRDIAVAALRTAFAEGLQDYVTCREGDCRGRLPFRDEYFDVVVSAVHLSGAGGGEREVIRVLKGGGWGVVWDLGVPELVKRLRDLRMEDIRVSERVTAYMVPTHIVSFRKPLPKETMAAGLEGHHTILCC